jgi:hypothetical protein
MCGVAAISSVVQFSKEKPPMFKSISLGLALALGLFVAAQAEVATETTEELKSGLQPGDRIGAFTVTKVAGAVDDGVEDGTDLCYRCMLGNRPVVAVFAREVNENTVALVKELDKLVAKNKDKQMGSFVNLLGEDKEALSKEAKKLAKVAESKHVAVVVPEEHQNAPDHLKINEKADITVLIYKEGVIEKSLAFAKDEFCTECVKHVLADSDTILK